MSNYFSMYNSNYSFSFPLQYLPCHVRTQGPKKAIYWIRQKKKKKKNGYLYHFLLNSWEGLISSHPKTWAYLLLCFYSWWQWTAISTSEAVKMSCACPDHLTIAMQPFQLWQSSTLYFYPQSSTYISTGHVHIECIKPWLGKVCLNGWQL